MNLVEVYATVTDRRGEPVTGLAAADFRIVEDGTPQAITAFAAGEFPLAVAIGLDRSFSMAGSGNRLGVAKSAARTFVGALRPDRSGDGDRDRQRDRDRRAAVDRTARRRWRRSIDSTRGARRRCTTPRSSALDAIQPAKGRRALVLLSDGTDRYSDTRAADLVEQARRRDVLIYPIALGRARPPVFAELAAATGGRSFHAPEPRELVTTMTTIARELRFQYLLGLRAGALRVAGGRLARDRRQQSTAPIVRVRARDGYFSR